MYKRQTVSRLNYLLSDESDRHGLIIQLLNHLGEPEEEKEQADRLRLVAQKMNLSAYEILNDNPLYKRRRRRNFTEELVPDCLLYTSRCV